MPKKIADPDHRILILDIETFPLLASVWGLFDQNIGLEMIEKDWHLASFGAKWLGEKEVFYYDQSREKLIENDKGLLKKLHKLLSQCEIVVAHNGRKFDLPAINARFITQGFNPPSPYTVVDTVDIARRVFRFSSNKLAFLSGALCKTKKREHRKFPGFLLWKACLAGDKTAWREMELYNRDDVLALEELYLKLRPWSPTHPNLAVNRETEVPECPRCGSTKMNRNGFKLTSVGKYPRYQCGSCGGYARGAKLENTAEQRKALLRVI